MTLTLIVILATLGILCLLAEILLIPGIGLAGIVGTGATIGSAYLANQEYGFEAAFWIVIGELVLLALLCLILWNSSIRRRLSLSTKIDSQVNEQPKSISVGDKGVASTRLNLFGKAKFEEYGYLEVKATSFIDQGTEVKVVSLENNTILVEKA
ncbi:MAG: NfeD family protein [Bacteroidia bacterium]|nr:NfeD family protein [Bacteroidia bacterium]